MSLLYNEWKKKLIMIDKSMAETEAGGFVAKTITELETYTERI